MPPAARASSKEGEALLKSLPPLPIHHLTQDRTCFHIRIFPIHPFLTQGQTCFHIHVLIIQSSVGDALLQLIFLCIT